MNIFFGRWASLLKVCHHRLHVRLNVLKPFWWRRAFNFLLEILPSITSLYRPLFTPKKSPVVLCSPQPIKDNYVWFSSSVSSCTASRRSLFFFLSLLRTIQVSETYEKNVLDVLVLPNFDELTWIFNSSTNFFTATILAAN